MNTNGIYQPLRYGILVSQRRPRRELRVPIAAGISNGSGSSWGWRMASLPQVTGTGAGRQSARHRLPSPFRLAGFFEGPHRQAGPQTGRIHELLSAGPLAEL